MREATQAAVSPATPDPTTATRRCASAFTSPRSGRRGRSGRSSAGRSRSSGSTVIPTAAAAAADPSSTRVWSGSSGISPAEVNFVAVDEPQLVDLALGGGDHVLGADDGTVLGLGPDDGRAAGLAEVEEDLLGVGGLQDLLGGGQPGRTSSDVQGWVTRGADADEDGECRGDQKGHPAPPPVCASSDEGPGARRRGPRGEADGPGRCRRARRPRSEAGGATATVSDEQGRGLAQLGHLGAAVVALGEVLLEARHARGRRARPARRRP